MLEAVSLPALGQRLVRQQLSSASGMSRTMVAPAGGMMQPSLGSGALPRSSTPSTSAKSALRMMSSANPNLTMTSTRAARWLK